MIVPFSFRDKKSQIDPIDETLVGSPRYWNDYTYTDSARLVFNKKNVDLVNRAFQEIMKRRYNVNVGKQNELFILEWLHEAYYKTLDENFHRIHSLKNSEIMRNRVRGYEYDYYEDKKRNILPNDEGRIRREIRDIINQRRPNIRGYERNEDFVKKINSIALNEMIRVAKYKIDGWRNYQKMYNLHPIDVVPITSFTIRPESEGLNSERKDSVPNGPIRMRPIIKLPQF